MNYWQVLNNARGHVGISERGLCAKIGVSSGYIAANKARGSSPTVDNALRMLDVCGYGLFAIPYGSEPKDAIRITADKD